MGKYTVTEGQNLYDVTLHLTGSVEGIVDLMICNPDLSLEKTLRNGDELIYTDGFVIDADVVARYQRDHIVPANGERNVYPKYPLGPLRLWFTVDAAAISTAFSLAGAGHLQVDWGDNSPLEEIGLTSAVSVLNHRFDNTIASPRRVRIYGDFTLQHLDLTPSGARSIRLSEPLRAERFTLCAGAASLDFMPLLEGVFRVALNHLSIGNLLSLVECRELMSLDLTDADVSRAAVDAFLIDLVTRHYGRRNCEIRLTTAPYGNYSEPCRDDAGNYLLTTGMEAVWLLTHEESWNEGGAWSIRIGEECYRYQPNNPS